MELFSDVLAAIKPTRQEVASELDNAKELVRHITKKAPPTCEVVLTGSMAKKTFLRTGRDIDIFVLFERSTPKGKLEPAIKKIMDRAFPGTGYQLSYAEHPYVRFHYNGRRVDLVPAYKISRPSERLSAVDRSVLHTKFVRNSMKVKQTDEVLLLKQFLKSNELYGAEIKVEGFSGYLCELLIIKYGTFRRLVREASKWKDVFIDIRKFHSPKEKDEAKKRFASRFIVIDPTDKDRNVAAAVSDASYRRFISLCKSFLKKPSKKFFFRLPDTFEQKVKKASKGKKLIILSMPRPDVVDDVLWGQIHKLVKQLKEALSDFGPKEILADDSHHMVKLAVVLKSDRLPAKMLVVGPPLKMKKHVEKFRKAHKKAKFVKKGGKLYAEVKRPVTKAEKALSDFFKKYSETKSHLAYSEEMILIERQ
jgi:tRNA nucleotidyltransferase (CCA-adding enzyme)